ncbi:hypothetical protein [Candidatus Marimicrobium litorale]|uniref:CheW-like domain-containing protein n=1 Tax=Candidatus Marimicrobium litorale TaxID=2518991 RepID=A0ABT3T651_9GAMM|nr:hypothetical protein [Candidatus Marimicrobium litorale]MCX2977763.1 hypothetical protein [Candidatus Marimicrobium litorale]
MTQDTTTWCVLIPCCTEETWAVPQQCLGEIVTVQSESDAPPAELDWRGQSVPVFDLGAVSGPAWREPRRGSGLVAIFVGLKGEACEYWGIPVRGKGLRMVSLAEDDVEDTPVPEGVNARAAFKFEGETYQVPDLECFQKQVVASR